MEIIVRIKRGGILTAEKRCNQCGETKPLSDFYRQQNGAQGVMGMCKECKRAGQRAYAAGNRERLRAVAQTRYHENVVEERAKSRARRRKDMEHAREYKREWVEQNREATRQHARDYYQRHKMECLARTAVGNAIKKGDMPPASDCTCAHCGQPAEHYHHADYGRPLDVTPLCVACHKRVHVRELESVGA